MAISVGDAVLKLGIDTKDFDQDMKGIKEKTKKNFKAIGAGMTIAGGAILGVLGLATKAAADFEGAMRKVNSMIGLGQIEFQELSDEVQDLSKDLGVDAVDSANALYQAISAGVPRDNAIEFLQIATKAAIAGVTSTEIAVDGLTTVINAFRLPLSDTQRVADIMFQTVKGGKTTFEELSASLFNVAPLAKASGVSFEEVAAALASMTKQGVPTNVATTQLRAAIQALSAPTEGQIKQLKALGLEMSKEALETNGLAATMQTLLEATGGNMSQLRQLVGSVEGVQAILALAGDNAEVFAADLEAVRSASEGAGAATDAFNEINKSFNRQMALLGSEVKNIKVAIGNQLIPVLIPFFEKVKEIVGQISDWMEENKELTRVIVLGAAAVGGLLFVLGPLVIALPFVAAGFGMVTAAAAPISLTILGIAAAVAGLVLIWKNWDTVKATFLNISNAIGRAFRSKWGWILPGGVFIKAMLSIKDHWDAVWKAIHDTFFFVGDIIMEGVQNMANNVIKIINGMIWAANRLPWVNIAPLEEVEFNFRSTFEAIKKTVIDVFTTNVRVVKDATESMIEDLELMDFILGKTKDSVEALKEEFSGFAEDEDTDLQYFDRATESILRVGEAVEGTAGQWERYFEILRRGESASQRGARRITQEDVEGLTTAEGRSAMLRDFMPGGRFYAKGVEAGVTIPESFIQMLAAAMGAAAGGAPAEWVAEQVKRLRARFTSQGAFITKMAHGGVINEPTLLYGLRSMRPYAVAGENGPERVSPMNGAQAINFTLEMDGETVARVVGIPLVDQIRLKTGVGM